MHLYVIFIPRIGIYLGISITYLYLAKTLPATGIVKNLVLRLDWKYFFEKAQEVPYLMI